MGPFQDERINRADQSQPQYTTLEQLDNDLQHYGRDLQTLRTLELRVCVYRIAKSVPLVDAKALRSTGRWL
ncbi:MAG: hypothetical protein LAC69_04385 [Chlorobium sp.]|nr:hypothetical protein [Chlorobium sp.]